MSIAAAWDRRDNAGTNYVRDFFLRPGVRVLSPNGIKQVGTILRRVPGRNVVVRVDNEPDPAWREQTWWMGNLRIVL